MKLISMVQISKKDILLLVRDKAALFFTIGFPLIMAIFFGTVFSGNSSSPGISLAIADQDNSPGSQAYIETLTKSDALRITLMDEGLAKEKVRKGKISAMIVIPEGFGESKASLFDNNTPQIQLGIDPSRKAAAGMLKGILMAQAAEDMQNQFTDTSQMIKELNNSLESIDSSLVDDPELTNMLGSLKTWMEKEQQSKSDKATTVSDSTDNKSVNSRSAENNAFQGLNPLVIKDKEIIRQKTGPRNAYAISFPQGMIWGIIGAITTFSLVLITEVNEGTMSRLSSAPISRMTILGGKALACFFTIISVCCFLIAVGFFVFGITIFSWPVLILSILSSAIGFSGLMMFLAVLGKTEKAASGISWAILMIMAMTGGGMIPIMMMPKWMAAIGEFSPVKWAVVSFEGSFWRQYSMTELLPFSVLLVTMGLICFIAGSYIFNKREIS